MRKQKGFSLIELLIVVAIILIIAAIAIPNLLRARIAANESSAVASLRTINTAHDFLQLQLPDGRLCDHPDPIVGHLHGHRRSHIDYRLLDRFDAGMRHQERLYRSPPSGTSGGYAAWANPVTTNTTGVRAFCSVADAVVRTSTAPESAPAPEPKPRCSKFGFGKVPGGGYKPERSRGEILCFFIVGALSGVRLK